MLHVDPRLDVALFALDWGTSTCRVWALGSGGQILASARSNDGMRSVANSAETQNMADPSSQRATAFISALEHIASPAISEYYETPIVACGMVGSASGWEEVPYLETPVQLGKFPLTPVRYRDRNVWIVPGVRQTKNSINCRPDVMRGEETQLSGMLEEGLLDSSPTVIMPGTHTKWVKVKDGRLICFVTAMTGELFGTLLQGSTLGHVAQNSRLCNRAVFQQGLNESRSSRLPLAARLFSVRARVLSGELTSGDAADYLSGILIGDEIFALAKTLDHDTPIKICGDGELAVQYQSALELAGFKVAIINGDVVVKGLWRAASQAGLITRGGT